MVVEMRKLNPTTSESHQILKKKNEAKKEEMSRDLCPSFILNCKNISQVVVRNFLSKLDT